MKHKIVLSVEMEVEASGQLDRANREHLEFYFEACKCGDDLVEQLTKEVEEATKRGTCTCHRMTIKYIGPVSGEAPGAKNS
jgi:Zn finger protein HypA/HybF involved in hydrogenase expression